MSLTIGGDGAEWKLFGRKAQTGGDILFRSRTQVPAVQAYALANPMVRIRFALAGARGDFEQSLLSALERANAEAYLLATIASDVSNTGPRSEGQGAPAASNQRAVIGDPSAGV